MLQIENMACMGCICHQGVCNMHLVTSPTLLAVGGRTVWHVRSTYYPLYFRFRAFMGGPRMQNNCASVFLGFWILSY